MFRLVSFVRVQRKSAGVPVAVVGAVAPAVSVVAPQPSLSGRRTTLPVSLPLRHMRGVPRPTPMVVVQSRHSSSSSSIGREADPTTTTAAARVQALLTAIERVRAMPGSAAPSQVGPIMEADADVIAQRRDPLTDMRAVAKEALQHYVEAALGMLSISQEDMSPTRDTNCVPRCVIHGAAGTGKTTALRLACEWFTASNSEQKHWRALFATFSEKDGNGGQAFDAHKSTSVRVAHRLLYAAIDSQASLATAVDALRRELGLSPVAEGVKGNEWYDEPAILVPALRMALEMGDDDHLLLAVDDLQSVERKHVPEHRVIAPRESWVGLYYLRGLSQESFFRRRGAGVVLFVASAPSTNNVYDKSPLHVLPLPPVDVEPFVDSGSKILAVRNNKALNKKQRTFLRKILLQASFNAQCLRDTYTRVIEKEKRLLSTVLEYLNSIEDDVVKIMLSKVDAFLKWSARHDHVHVFALLRALFWPLRVDAEARRFSHGPEMYAALVGENFGICAVVRHQDGQEKHPYDCPPWDTVTMNPWMCALLCSRLDKATIENAQATMEKFGGGSKKAKENSFFTPRSIPMPRPGPDCSVTFVRTLSTLLTDVCKLMAAQGSGGGANDNVSVSKHIGLRLRACRTATAPCCVSPEELEVDLAHDDMHGTCPMIAYSGCYARGITDK